MNTYLDREREREGWKVYLIKYFSITAALFVFVCECVYLKVYKTERLQKEKPLILWVVALQIKSFTATVLKESCSFAPFLLLFSFYFNFELEI